MYYSTLDMLAVLGTEIGLMIPQIVGNKYAARAAK